MHSIKKNTIETIHEPGRNIPVIETADVAVCGGGVSGVAAAIAASRQKARVVLIEKQGFSGGTNTASGVNGVGGWQYDFNGSPLIGGIPLEIMRRVADAGGADPELVAKLSMPKKEKPDYRDGGLGCYWIRTHPEYVKIVLDDMLDEAGVSVYYHARAVRPIMEDNRISGIFMECVSGRKAVCSEVVIDCTGDGTVAAEAGADFEIGRPEDHVCQPMSMIYTAGDTHVPHLSCKADTEKGDAADIPSLARNRYEGAVRKARESGDIVYNPNDIFCSATPLDTEHPDIKSINFTRIQKKSSADADELTQSEKLGRKQVIEGLRFMQKYIKGCEHSFLVSIPPHIGVRESRRITGDYILTGEDVQRGADFPDTIARGIYLLDIHNPDEIGSPSTLTLLDKPYSIPYRCLLPKGVESLLVAGRCISGDYIALASYRIQSHCMALGEAAGTGAGLAVKHKCTPRELDTDILQKTLLDQGVNLGI